MNKRTKRTSVLLALTLSSLFSAKAYADSQHLFTGGFQRSSGTPSLNLSWTYSTTDTYANAYIVPAANNWNGISFQVQLTKITSGTYKIRASSATTNQFGLFGRIIPYCTNSGVSNSGDVCLSNPAWGSVGVIGYDNQMANYNFTGTQTISNYTHEFGHALSLAHVVDTSSYTYPPAVMKQGQQSIGPQQVDKDHLRQKWGN